MIARCLGLLMGVAVAVAGAQDPLRTLPKNYWVEFETPWVRVIHVRYRPHEIVPLHDHPGPATLFVYLSDAGQVRFLHGESDVVDGVRPAVKVGQMRLNPGKTETHRVENVSDQQSDFLRVEFPTVPLGLPDFDVRIAPANEAFWQAETANKVEFEDTHLRVVRWGVPAHGDATLKASPDRKTAWLAVRVEGATVEGKPAHAGQAWADAQLAVHAGAARVEIVEVELK